nr:hypothetical protein Iba_chr14cCG13570 [Ipomoea batatas]
MQAIGPVENPVCLYWLKVLYIILGGFSLGISFTLMFASIPKEPKDNHFKPVFSLQSMCLGMSLALYTARFQEWLRLVPPGQAPPPQNGNVPRPAAAGAQAGQNVDGSSAAGGQPLQNVGAPPAQLQNENDPLLEDEDNAGDQLAVESEVAAPSDYAAFEIEN